MLRASDQGAAATGSACSRPVRVAPRELFLDGRDEFGVVLLAGRRQDQFALVDGDAERPNPCGGFEHIVSTANDTGAATTTVVESVGEDDVGDEPDDDGGGTSIFVWILLPFVVIVIVIAGGYWLIRRESG